MSPVSQFQELRHRTGSLAKAAESAGLNERHARRLLNEPGRGALVQAHTRRQVAAALEELSPFPLALPAVKHGRAVLITLESSPGSDLLRDFLCSYGPLLEQEPDDDHARLEYRYMRMMIATSKAMYHGGKANWFSPRSKNLQDAQKDAESAINLADEMLLTNPEDVNVRHLRAILCVNWTQIILEQVKAKSPGLKGTVMTITEMRNLFREKDALGQLKDVVKQFPYLWTAAYNGLEQSSVLEDDDNAEWFYTELKRMDGGFQDFDYSPGELVSIAKEPGMSYFYAKFFDKYHTPNAVR